DYSTCKRDSIVRWDWTFGDGEIDTLKNPAHIYIHRGLYQPSLKVTSDAGCTNAWEDPSPIIVNEKPIADFVPSFDTVSTLNNQIHFVNTSISANRWFWEYNGIVTSIEKNPSFANTDTGLIKVMLVSYNPYNCADTAMKYIYVYPQATIFFTNAFTPNTDDLNETWGPDGVFDGIRKYKLSIYNRWGERVFVTEDITYRWNGLFDNTGKTCQEDVYIYRVDYTDFNYKKHFKQGEIHLLR
ncbi:MAG: gliding motility-associated C-terminal domain-containing protein, partial [Bacteroidetes bacterium]|nr:gliding motility-associated C-terminal domain-containing protein [Bacteroidota bacterium]